MSEAPAALAGRLVAWMSANRPRLDELMTQEGSRSVHQEFLEAEGGMLPTRAERLSRARDASGRAWLRYMAAALEEVWPAAPEDLAQRMDTTLVAQIERLEAIQIDERAGLERHGRAGDPEADRRLLELAAQRRFFGEALGDSVPEQEGPALGRRISAWGWGNAARLRELSEDALAASGVGETIGGMPPEIEILWERSPDVARSAEAALMWANMRFLAEALDHELTGPAGAG